MKTNKKLLSTFIILLISSFFAAHSQVLNDAQLLKPGNWVYEAMQDLSTESRKAIFMDTQPISVGELKFYLSKINYESLSESGKALYSKVEKYLYTSNSILYPNDSATKLYVNVKLTPEYYLRTNKEIPSTAGKYFESYPLEIPMMFGFSENVAFQLDYFYGKNRDGYLSLDTFTNIPLSEGNDFEYPRWAYGNVGNNFSNWGFSASFGKEGFTIGNSKLGSVIYNSTFETDFYSVLSAYSENVKYNLIVSQVDSTRFLYLHNFNMNLLPNLKFSMTEGCLKDGGFQLRYLNPTMIVHSFYSASDYPNYPEYQNISGDFSGHCSYMGVTLEYQPVKNLRIYAIYAQNELQAGGELDSDYGKSKPDGIGLQTGIDYIIPHKNENYFKINVESVYNTPFLYLKQTPSMSLIKYENVFSEETKYVNYIGSPFGSDVFALNLSLDYKKPQKWSAGFTNLLTIKGEINENKILNTYKYGIPFYYPSVIFKSDYATAEEKEAALVLGRQKRLTGTLQYRNDTSLSFEYFFSDKLKVATEGTYSFIINNKNVQGDFKQGFELKLAVSYNLF